MAREHRGEGQVELVATRLQQLAGLAGLGNARSLGQNTSVQPVKRFSRVPGGFAVAESARVSPWFRPLREGPGLGQAQPAQGDGREEAKPALPILDRRGFAHRVVRAGL